MRNRHQPWGAHPSHTAMRALQPHSHNYARGTWHRPLGHLHDGSPAKHGADAVVWTSVQLALPRATSPQVAAVLSHHRKCELGRAGLTQPRFRRGAPKEHTFCSVSLPLSPHV